MSRERSKRRFQRIVTTFVAAVITMTAIPFQVFAAKNNTPSHYYNNGIRWYNPDESCGTSGSAFGGGDSDGSDVYLIGDSISVHSQNQIKEALPNITFTNESIRSGSYFAQDSSVYGPSGISRLDNIGSKEIVVFALGTNGGISEDDITALVNKLSGKNVKVILMTIFYSDNFSQSQMNSTNTVVKNAASRYDNITYMDWAAEASKDQHKYIDTDHIHPTDPDGRKLFAQTIKNAVNEITTMGSNISTGGTGNFDKILTAKNANEYVFDVPSYSQWSAQWGDGDKETMKKLLENYGDLAYQLGDAVGAPYIAILVQMRYEDPNSVCGANNFWGNGCDSAHAYRGGATIQGKDLGEGFVQYGKTLTNGYHDQALGEKDPKRYLELIGPTWVQGDPNGPGYSTIDGMRHSVDALTAYIESPEGQEIVKQFGNYHGTYKGGSKCDANKTAGNGVTTLNIDGVTYAFPLAYATKENYLNNNDVHPSVLSSKVNGWYHHDYPAVDLGIYMKMVTGKDFTASDFPEWPTSSTLGDNSGTVNDVKHMNSSTGANVVSLTDGVVTYYQHYTNQLSEADSQICAIASVQSSSTSDRYIYIHMGWDDEYAAKVGQQVKAGDVIGRVGKMPCAQYTQSHLHLQTGDKDPKIKTIIDKLYDALPADAAELAAREAAGNVNKEDGLTYEQAVKFMKAYGANKNGSVSSANPGLWPMCNGGGSNCVTFSAIWINKFTSAKVSAAPGNGHEVVSNLRYNSTFKGTIDTTPKVWSVFSWSNGGYGHTGVILGYHNGEWIVGHASCSNPGIGEGYGTYERRTEGSGFVIKSSDIYTAVWGGSNHSYAHFENQVDLAAISKFLETGE